MIRRYRDGDGDAVWRLHNEALLPTGAHLGAGPWDDDLNEIPTRYLDGSGEFLIGELDGDPVAMGALRRFDLSTAEIKRMRVLPAFQHLGYGTQILRELEARARELGYEGIRLDTTDHQVAARRFYEKHGYRETGQIQAVDLTLRFYAKTL